mgnify:CR=1 FL=1
MFAIAFDMSISALRKYYGEPYNNAYFEINKMLRSCGFYNAQGSVYLTERGDMASLFKAILMLKNVSWFKNSVRDIRGFKVEDWSDFTAIVKDDRA